MSDDLPRRRSLDSLKKEAKRRAGLGRAVPGSDTPPTLRDVQHALAQEHGFTGWAALKNAVEQTLATDRAAGAKALAQYEAMAEALLEAYRTGTPEAMERHYRYTWHRRAWQAMRTYVQLDLGKRPTAPDDAVEITLDDARHLVALEHGFASWADLREFTESSLVGPRVAAKPVRVVRRQGPDEWQALASSREWDEIIRLLALHPDAGLSAEGQMTDAMLEEVSRIETLTGLGLSGCRHVTDDGMRHLARLTSLQHLDLSGTAITDAGLQVLRHLPELRTISLAGTRVTDEGVGALAHCHQLEHVNLAGTAAGDGALRALAGKRRLHRLALNLTDAGFPLLHELPVFKSWQGGDGFSHESPPNHLSVRGWFTDRGMRHLKGLDGLYSLDVDDRRLAITASGLEPLVALPHLGSLAVDAKDDWMPPVAEIPRLRFLDVQDTVAGDNGFVALSRSRSIERIWGRRCHNLRTRGFIALAAMPALRSLSVSCLNVDDTGISALPSFPALRELMPMDIPDAGYRHVAGCEQLESLILMYCRDTTDAATEHITGLRKLTHYFNSYTTVTDRTPELLSTMVSLERVTFDTCHGLTNAGVARLARLPKLRELRVSGKGITSGVHEAFPSRIRVFSEG